MLLFLWLWWFTILLASRDLPHCFVSMTVKDSGALEPQSACVRICVSPLGVLSSDTKRGYVIYVWLKGFSTDESHSLQERAYIVRTPVGACTRPVEFYRSEQVKTAHGVSLFLSHFRSVAFFQEPVTVPWNVFHPGGWNTFCQAFLSTNPVPGANGFRCQISVSDFQLGEMLVPDLLLVVNWFPF